jgi:hypothetical protein
LNSSTERGDAPLDVELRFFVPLETIGIGTAGSTANGAGSAMSVIGSLGKFAPMFPSRA